MTNQLYQMRNTGGKPLEFHSEDEKRSFYRRADHSDLEAMIALVLDHLKETAGLEEIPRELREIKTAIQSDAYARVNAYESINAPFADLGQYLGFTGSPDAIQGRVRHRLKVVEDFSTACGRVTFGIERGGELLRDERGHPVRDELGEVIRTSTKIIDYLKAESDKAVQLAKAKAKNDVKKWHKFRDQYLKAEVAPAIERLPRWTESAVVTLEGKGKGDLPTNVYIERGIKSILTRAENFALKVEEHGFDAYDVLEEIETKLSQIRQSLKKTARARLDNSAVEKIQNGENSSKIEETNQEWVMSALPTQEPEQPSVTTQAPPVFLSTEGYAELKEIANLDSQEVANLEVSEQAKVTLQTFGQLGAKEIGITVKNEVIEEDGLYRLGTHTEQIEMLGDYLKLNEAGFSIIARPILEAGRFVQQDDLSEESLKDLLPYACLAHETSPGRFQAWVAIDKPELALYVERGLCAALHTDKAATGATRLPGTKNCKPERNRFVIRLIKVSPHIIALNRIENIFGFSVQDIAESEHRQVKYVDNLTNNKTWCGSIPNYSMARGQSASEKDASFLKTCFNWGVPKEVAFDELAKCAGRKKLRRRDYLERTWKFISEH